MKKDLLDYCLHKNQERLDEIILAIAHAQDAIENDTKSSAGDKYETTREMVQQDLNRYQEQLLQAKKDTVVLQQLELDVKKVVGLGAVIITDSVRYFIAISLGRQVLDGQEYMIISASSPIGRLLLGKTVGDTITFNGNTQVIRELY